MANTTNPQKQTKLINSYRLIIGGDYNFKAPYTMAVDYQASNELGFQMFNYLMNKRGIHRFD
jgi:hypothetical protein